MDGQVLSRFLFDPHINLTYYYFPILQMRTLRNREAKWLLHGHVTSQWWSQGLPLGQWFSIGVILSPRGYWALFGDIFGCHNREWGAPAT